MGAMTPEGALIVVCVCAVWAGLALFELCFAYFFSDVLPNPLPALGAARADYSFG